MHLSPLCFLALLIAFVSHNVAEGFGIGGPILLPSRMSPAPCRHVDRRWLKTRRQHHHHRHRLLGDVTLQMTLGDDDSERNDKSLLSTVSLGVLPIVWASLATVATTGAGLPPGPFGLLGALEGVSYLLMLTLVGKFVYRSLVKDGDNDGDMILSSSGILAERLAVFSLALSLLVLASLVVKQGCVPNAKPILDYSAYVPICDASPGLFGE